MTDAADERIEVRVNEQRRRVSLGWTLRDVVRSTKADADIVVHNGFPAAPDTDSPLRDGDEIVLIRRGETPTSEELEALLVARHGPGVHEVVKKAVVGIAGCGGLGSHVALALARTGVGGLVLVDFDVVEPSNLNRQHYFVDQIGQRKVEALAETLHRVNPYVRIERHPVRVTGDNVDLLFRGCDIVAECLDTPSGKAEIARALARASPRKPLVTVSGIAGYGPAGAITSRRIFEHWFLIGDNESDARPGRGLLAPRVAVAAGHQANVVLRWLLGAIAPSDGG